MRRLDWTEALYAYIDARREVPFQWGSQDCSTFAAGAVEAITGEAPELPVATTAAEAVALMAERPLRDRVGDLYGPEIVPAFAQRGDLVLIEIDGRESVAVCIGAEAIGPAADGLLAVPMALAVAAWRV